MSETKAPTAEELREIAEELRLADMWGAARSVEHAADQSEAQEKRIAELEAANLEQRAELQSIAKLIACPTVNVYTAVHLFVKREAALREKLRLAEALAVAANNVLPFVEYNPNQPNAVDRLRSALSAFRAHPGEGEK